MIDKNTFKQTFAAPLRDAGFLNKGQSWYPMAAEATVVLNLQKSDWDNMYYLNFGVWLNVSGESGFHEEHLCHTRARAERLFPADRELILSSCSLNDSDEELLAEFTQFIGTKLVPSCIECTKLSALRSYSAQGRFGGEVTSVGRDLLSGSRSISKTHNENRIRYCTPGALFGTEHVLTFAQAAHLFCRLLPNHDHASTSGPHEASSRGEQPGAKHSSEFRRILRPTPIGRRSHAFLRPASCVLRLPFQLFAFSFALLPFAF